MATKKIPFRTIQDPQVRIYSPSGEMIEDVWSMRINDNGEEEFYVSGKTNIYEAIQAFADEVDVEKIIARVTATGDTSILNKVQGIYADITTLPTNLFEAHQIIRDAENVYNELPVEIRQQYNNSFSEYLKDFGTENWAKIMGLIKEPETIPEKSGGKEETPNE